jgi:hypothetical protein
VPKAACTVAEDERGLPRPGAPGTACDAGAYELQGTHQTITFTAPSGGTVGGSATLGATGGGSGNPVAFSVDPTSGAGVCSLTGTTVRYLLAGTCVLDANQAGTAVYFAAPQVTQSIAVTAPGYDLVGADGGVFVFNPPKVTGGFFGSLPGLTPPVRVDDVVGMVPTVNDQGYFLVGADGGVFSFGNAPFLGSLPGLAITPAQPVVGIIAANTDKGYYLVGRDGGVFAFGSVPFLGSLPGTHISVDDVIGIAATPSADGYWVVTATGKVYAFGAAQAFTSAATTSPVTAIAGTRTGGGYWLVTKEGGVYPYGSAHTVGTQTLPHIGVTPSLPVIGIVPTDATRGYWLLGADGGIFAFATAPYYGSLPGLTVHVTDIVGAVPN